MNDVYQRRRDLVCDALAQAGVNVDAAEGHDLHLGAGPAGFDSAAAYCEHVLEQAAVVISPGGAYGTSGEGFFRISLTTPDDRLLEAVSASAGSHGANFRRGAVHRARTSSAALGSAGRRTDRRGSVTAAPRRVTSRTAAVRDGRYDGET